MPSRVTIGICVRNEEKTLRKTIKSIFWQNYPHDFMEIIFVDDGSEDLTLPIIYKVSSERLDIDIKVFHHKWQGLGKSRNVVINNAKSDYIIWVDGDIILSQDYVSKQVEFMEQNLKVGIAGGRFEVLHDKNLLVTLDNAEVIAKDHLYGKKIRTSPMYAHMGMAGTILRVEALRRVKGFNPYIIGAGEDVEFVHRLVNSGWLIYIGNEATFFHKGKETLIDTWNQNAWYGYSYCFLRFKSGAPNLFSGTRYAYFAYRLLYDRRVLLLVYYYYFKKFAWIYGFVKGNVHNLLRTLRNLV